MNIIRRYHFVLLSSVGAAAFAASAVIVSMKGPSLGDLLLLGLAIPAGWLRVKLEPAGFLTLAPVVVFAGVLLTAPYIPVLIAALSAFVSARLFASRTWLRTMEEMGEEAIPALIAVLLIMGTTRFPPHALPNPVGLLSFALAVVVYITTRFVLAAIRANLAEGIGILGFLFAGGKSLLVNLLFFAVVALGMSYLTRTYGSLGYFALALATIALVESYQPYKLLSEQKDVLYSSLAMIAQAIDLKDAYTGKHARDVSGIAVRITRSMRLPEAEVEKIRIAGILHDIGKIGVSGRIIRKPAKLDPDETLAMRRHPVIGAEIMQPVELLSEAAEIVRHHHEHLDGSGYPDGLKGEEIPIGSRIVLVADAFNAITTDRPYRRGRSKEEALEVLKEHAGRQFDQKVVRALESIIDLI